MVYKNLGFNHDLYILPFDHRGSFQEKLFGIKDRLPSAAETREISAFKRIVYEGFRKSIAAGVPKDKAGILVDEQFGNEILHEARAAGFFTACPAEKTGQDEFDFEYGDHFTHPIEKCDPTFVKVLVRYNPEGDSELNRRQCERLKKLSDYCHQGTQKLMFELLVPANQAQLKKAGDSARYDRNLRPTLMVRAMKEIQSAGIEPDLWKLEGIEEEKDSVRVSEQARMGGRSNVGVIVLGRGENAEKVSHWLRVAARVPGFIGFAVGRTLFWEPLKDAKSGKISKEVASDLIARNFKALCDLWAQERIKNL